jgi:hypothetical protein
MEGFSHFCLEIPKASTLNTVMPMMDKLKKAFEKEWTGEEHVAGLAILEEHGAQIRATPEALEPLKAVIDTLVKGLQLAYDNQQNAMMDIEEQVVGTEAHKLMGSYDTLKDTTVKLQAYRLQVEICTKRSDQQQQVKDMKKGIDLIVTKAEKRFNVASLFNSGDIAMMMPVSSTGGGRMWWKGSLERVLGKLATQRIDLKDEEVRLEKLCLGMVIDVRMDMKGYMDLSITGNFTGMRDATKNLNLLGKVMTLLPEQPLGPAGQNIRHLTQELKAITWSSQMGLGCAATEGMQKLLEQDQAKETPVHDYGSMDRFDAKVRELKVKSTRPAVSGNAEEIESWFGPYAQVEVKAKALIDAHTTKVGDYYFEKCQKMHSTGDAKLTDFEKWKADLAANAELDSVLAKAKKLQEKSPEAEYKVDKCSAEVALYTKLVTKYNEVAGHWGLHPADNHLIKSAALSVRSKVITCECHIVSILQNTKGASTKSNMQAVVALARHEKYQTKVLSVTDSGWVSIHCGFAKLLRRKWVAFFWHWVSGRGGEVGAD